MAEFDNVREVNMGRYVHDFLDGKFGDDLDELQNLVKVVQDQEKLKKNLEKKIMQCRKDTKLNIVENSENGRLQVERIDSLISEQATVKELTDQHLLGQDSFCTQLRHLNDQVEEMSCFQVYLSWILQICHLSKELHSELEHGNVALAVDFCAGISDILQRLTDSKCHNLVSYALNTQKYWLDVVMDILSRNMEEILAEMKWPFPTGVSAPALSHKRNDLMTKFDSIIKLFLKLHTENKNKRNNKFDPEITKLCHVLVKPLQKRFLFHFYGSRKTNNLEKPEWYLTQVLNWIRDHYDFLVTYVQPFLDNAGLEHHFIQHEFIRLLLQTCKDKVINSLPQICQKEDLFSHFIDEILLFDKEIRTVYNFPSCYLGCISALMEEPYLHNWLQLEKKYAMEAINDLLAQERAMTTTYNDVDSYAEAFVPVCVENFMAQLSVMTDRYRYLGDSKVQLQFVDLQIFLLNHFLKRLKEVAKMATTSFDNDALFAVLNGCQYMSDVLTEWSEQVFFIQLHCTKLQRPNKSAALSSTRLDDSMTENSVDISSESTNENSNLFVDKTSFDDVLESLDEFIFALTSSFIKNFEIKLKPKLAEYASEKWHCFPSTKELVTPMVSNAACGMLMHVKETLRSTQHDLCPSIFTRLWQDLARSIDSLIYNEVIMENHFNEGGAMQLKFDLIKNLLLLFEAYTQKPESYFKLIKESCCLMNLLPGSAALLKDVLKMVERPEDNGKEQRYKDAVNALSDITIKYISVPMASRILSLRIDWPKL